MSVSRLSIQSLRNLESVSLTPSPRTNLIYGQNGSGKTSVLEAVHTLALGRSFRSHKHKPLIQWGREQFTVFAEIQHQGSRIPVGLQRALTGEVNFKVNGRAVGSLAELASVLPLQVIDAHTFLLLEGSPKVRRQFMDWLVFHVEPSFFPAWKAAQRCLKQRNSLLRRDRIEPSELSVWDRELSNLTQQIHECREKTIERFRPVFLRLLEEFIRIPGVSLSYQRGWDKNRSYQEVLADNFERDRHMGYTQSGSHRADLRINVEGQPAGDILSRGQQKLVVCALKIAQGYVYAQETGGRCIYLVDDLPAELDGEHRATLVDWLDKLETQVFITGVDKPSLLADWQDRPDAITRVFHVEQGTVTADVNTEQQ
ncbi:DNA replication/repair protein RecF [Marinimicrobium koreense]|jgi:DNA replication and repair protein RecF|uniref:DNA replication/repair protein RecF n=1 Tax=Marinimicrobium koreense TaxID=306545 RepID=UPI003F715403